MNEPTIWHQRHEHAKKVRASRRGWPARAVRPLCIGCNAPLRPRFQHLWDHPIDSPLSAETDVLSGWGEYGETFCSKTCLMLWALRQPFVKAARLNNEALAERLRNQREESKR